MGISSIFNFFGFMDFLGCSAVFLTCVWFVSDRYEFNVVYAVWLLRNCWEKKMGISSIFYFYVFMDFLGCSVVFLMWVWFVSDGYEFNVVTCYCCLATEKLVEKWWAYVQFLFFNVFMDFWDVQLFVWCGRTLSLISISSMSFLLFGCWEIGGKTKDDDVLGIGFWEKN